MQINTRLIRWLIFSLFLSLSNCWAETLPLKSFDSHSYSKIKVAHANNPFILILWSINCPTCLAEMRLISSIHEQNPKLSIVMVATDDLTASEQIQMYLDQYQLDILENWIFAKPNSVEIRKSIDKDWRGEIPHSYFFNSNGRRRGYSGILTIQEFQQLVGEISND